MGVKFTDEQFPPCPKSLFINSSRPLQKLLAVNDWDRAENVFKKANKKPRLFSGPTKPQDVRQGALGDCWFLSAVAVLTEEREIKDVVITPEYNEEGIYTFRFCIQGEWQPVIVDDWIPLNAKRKPAFAMSKKEDELWLTLLEKAYAKLHGSYEALEGGVVQDALVDLTGGAGEEIDMRNQDKQLEIASGRLWSQLMRFKEEGFLLGVGSPSGSDTEISPNGIVQSHAYSLLQVREVDGHKLLQMRNPWGNSVEWSGPWSDSSPEWTERMKYKLKYTPKLSDGVFWMSWEDFQVHFRSVYVCRLYPPEMRKVVHGQWRGHTAGGCPNFDTWHNNPQFLLRGVGVDAHRPINVFMTLAQNLCGHPPFFIGLRVVKKGGERVDPILYVHNLAGASEYVNTREVACEMVLEPDPRGYTIVPTTHIPGEETSFRLSVFTKTAVELVELPP
ncbi:hypothetical protein CBR_g23680 [Chara braunii]|uniref:Calpain catalytic domain-containing protein n=1 Tax=Chara braunii TaxID=69332 RepID=A0A388L524_CHABU|nr:hypothetical protein CBR_g23680 [Chara braunii]|eukprot:GBG77348.1 hypothetical protein CBR_g23680 [Chara braunii]